MNNNIPPGYKQTEVGVIPEEWEVKLLGELAEFVTSGSRGWAEFYSESGALFIRSQNVRDGRLSFEDTQHVRPPSGAEGNRTKVYRNDLLITITGNSVGNVALVEQDFKEAYISQHVGMVRLHEAELGEYVCRYLSPNSPGNSQIAGSQSGQSKPGLNLQNLRDFRIAVPPTLPEQRAIATTLSDVDALIASLDKLIAKKRDMKQATMQELLTGKRRLPGFDIVGAYGNTPNSRGACTTVKPGECHSPLPDVPHGWEVKRLGEIADIVMGQSPSSSNYNTKGLGFPLIQGNADIANRKTIKRIYTTEVTKRGKCGDILMSVRAPVGEISLAIFDVCLGRGVCAIRYPNDYMYHYLVSQEPSWARLSKGSTFDSVNSADVNALEVRLPNDAAEQTAIAAILSDMDTEIAALEQKRNKTRLLKQGMMQELLTGRIRLV